MMNTMVKMMAAAGFGLIAMGASASQVQFEATDSRMTTQICVAAAQGKNLELRKLIKESRLSRDFVAEQVKCNELDFVTFVEAYGAKPVATNQYITAGRYLEQRSGEVLATR